MRVFGLAVGSFMITTGHRRGVRRAQMFAKCPFVQKEPKRTPKMSGGKFGLAAADQAFAYIIRSLVK
jgi:hypothetical protein